MSLRLRTIVYSHRFVAELEALNPQRDRIEEALRALEWALAKHPEIGQDTDMPGMKALPTTGEAWGAVPVIVYYAYNADLVELLSVLEVK